MAKKLTAGVLNGTAYKENFVVEMNGEEFEVEIKALGNSDATAVEELTQEGITMKGKPGLKGKMTRQMDFDTKSNLRGRNQSDVKAVALGTTDETITEEVVENEFPRKITKDIAGRVKQISGIGNQKEVEEFTEDNEEGTTPSDSNGE
ncbi:hypothetical protein [Virgibacillus sp. CBA3643]|uniref:hypothetical protein n=1 Tax=Virgibacillus sp. CBA3643 TaxID=2942278 RepID=UPI0035A3770A